MGEGSTVAGLSLRVLLWARAPDVNSIYIESRQTPIS